MAIKQLMAAVLTATWKRPGRAPGRGATSARSLVVVLTALLSIALAASLPTVPAEAQGGPTASLLYPGSGPTSVLDYSDIGQYGVVLDPAPTTPTVVTVVLRSATGVDLSELIDLERSGFSTGGTVVSVGYFTVPAGATELEIGIRTLPEPAEEPAQPPEVQVTLTNASSYQVDPMASRASFTVGGQITQPGIGPAVLPPGVLAGATNGGEAILEVSEGGHFQFGVFLAVAPRYDLLVRLQLLFDPSSPDQASIDDLASLDMLALIPTAPGQGTALPVIAVGNEYFFDVPFAAGQTAVRVQLHTRTDVLSPEGDSNGTERFGVAVTDVILPPRPAPPGGVPEEEPELRFLAPLELAMRDVAPAFVPGTSPPPAVITRPSAPILVELPEAEPVVGPLVAGAVTTSLSDNEVQLHLPAMLQLWLSPHTNIRVRHAGATLKTVAGSPETITITLTPGVEIDELTIEGFLLTGAKYTEAVAVATPA